MYRNKPIPVLTVPKGTLLFRKTDTPENDTLGVPTADGRRCITPHFQVFFYANPFTAEIALGKFADLQGDTHVYKTTRDLKVVQLFGSSPYSRDTRKTARQFIRECSKTKRGCMPREGKAYDACFSDAFLKKNPEIAGMIGISRGDGLRVRNALTKNKTLRNKKKYFHMETDANGATGPPELSIHPFAVRPSKSTYNDTDTERNFEHFTVLKTDAEKNAFMNAHTTYNSTTSFYVFRE